MADASLGGMSEYFIDHAGKRQSMSTKAQTEMTDSMRRQSQMRAPPYHYHVPRLVVDSAPLVNEHYQSRTGPFRQVPGVADGASYRRPQFQALYQEFESMKEKGFVTLPGIRENDLYDPVTKENAHQRGKEDFADAMRKFMSSYLPTSTFNGPTPTHDWTKEAENLLKELTASRTRPDAEKSSIWSVAPQNKFSWSGGTYKPSSYDEGYFDIHRHIMEINPSPYPGGSPTSSSQVSSNNCSDNDADDEEAQSSAESGVETIGATRKSKPDLQRSASTIDSGYLSSSTENDGRREGNVSLRQRSNSDSDEVSSISTAPPSPRYAYAWEDRKIVKPSRCIFPPPPQPPHFVAGLTSYPVPPPAQLLPQPNMQGAISMHHPAFLTGIPTQHRNVTFVTSVPQSYSQPQFARQRTDAVPAQAIGSTYHKHKPWITDEILEMIAVRDRLYKRMKKHPATDIVDMYKKVRNMVVGMTRNAKRSYEKRMEERVIERQLRNTNQVAESINASKSFASRVW